MCITSDTLKRADKKISTEDNLHPEQIKVWRGMSAMEKLLLANSLYWSAREAKAAWLRQIHPSFTEEQIEEKVRDIFLHAST